MKRRFRPLYLRVAFIYTYLRIRLRGKRPIEEDVDFALGYRFRNLTIAPVQVRSELVRLLGLLAEERLTAVLEIGTAHGGTLFLYTRVASDDATLVSVDLADPQRGGFAGGDHAENARLYRSFARKSQRVEFLQGDSHDAETLGRVKRALGDRPVDFLFIDGDHTYEGVRRDYEMYGPLVGRGGLIAFHDIADGPPEAVGGVPRFWREIRTPDALELIEDEHQGGFGIGVLRA